MPNPNKKTIYVSDLRLWTAFQRKCKRIHTTPSARIADLVRADLAPIRAVAADAAAPRT